MVRKAERRLAIDGDADIDPGEESEQAPSFEEAMAQANAALFRIEATVNLIDGRTKPRSNIFDT